MGFVLHCLVFPSSTPPSLSLLQTVTSNDRPFLCLESKGKRSLTDSLSTLQPRHLAVSAALGYSLIYLVRTIVAQFMD